jgi:dipeptidyl aminopeptidase/acylaminoacyl peptidase
MKMKSWLLLSCAFCLSAAAADDPRVFTPKDLNALARVSDPQVSPDGHRAVYAQRETDFDANRGRSDLWLLNLDDGAKPRRLTQHSSNDTHPRWSVDGTNIYFLSARGGTTQIWRLPLSGGEPLQITDFPLDIGSFEFSSGGGRIASTRPPSPSLPGAASIRCSCGIGTNGATALARTCSWRR